ncbi:reprolysin-like metallopeptidase [Flavobacterium sp.]|uniref:reprolysin-like metallopeptidase n=1 Tax=Flavobacterium sp. TaxID=239 RepID=UPI003D10A506
MKKLIFITSLFISLLGSAQNENNLWEKTTTNSTAYKKVNFNLPQNNIYKLDEITLIQKLAKAPSKNASKASNIIISLPNSKGVLESFQVFENSSLAPELAAKYPEIKSYTAISTSVPNQQAYLSISPLGLKGMIISSNSVTSYIEPIDAKNSLYTIYKSTENSIKTDFDCAHKKIENLTQKKANSFTARGADDSKLRTIRLAVACTGEYAAYFGGSKINTLASINNTITRINAVYERDFGVRLQLVANNDLLIYTDPSTDPYSDFATKYNWGVENHNNLSTIIGLSNFDMGHLFGAGTGNCGDAGGIGSVCSDLYKGRGYTCAYSGAYQGDTFDIAFVAHEMGHQLGANHSFTYKTESGSLAQMEVGSGSTIMSYGGTTIKDYQAYKDAYFHAISIQEVTDYIKTKTCPIATSTGNTVPVANAGLDFTIPKGTPFMLTGTASDGNSNDLLTYTWEQMDLGSATATVPTATATTGPLFRSFAPSNNSTRYFPTMTTILAGQTTTSGVYIASETLPSVARTLNFRLTVRDNRAGGGANNTDDMIVTVDGVAGPFSVDTQNTTASYVGGSTQTVNWTVAGTNANGVNCANVDILLSTDGGQTFPITLAAGTPNDGSHNVILPNVAGTTNRIMVKGSNHIFFDVNNADFTITAGTTVADTTSPSTVTVSASGTTASATNLSWTAATDNIGVTGYNVYQNGVLKTTTTATSLAVSGLSASTTYSFYVVARDAAGNTSANSNTVTVTTAAAADTTAPTTVSALASGTTASATNLSWTVATDNIGVTGYNVYQNGVLKTTTTTTSLAVSGLSASTTYNFYVVAKDAVGNTSANSNTVTVTTAAAADTTAPTTVTASASGTTTSATNLSWTVATDNTGVTGYNVYQNGVLKTTTTATSLAVSGLSASSAYNFYVVAKDAAGNLSANSNTVTVTTTAVAPTYCTSTGGTSKEYINRVQIGTINNLSGNNYGYGNFTAQSTSLSIGATATITVTPGWNGAAGFEAYNVWIDFNKNGSFDANELVFTKSKTKATSVSGSFTIPSTALTGATKMRVSMKNSVLPTACETFTTGEVEDYTINIASTTARLESSTTTAKNIENSKLNFSVYPNPVEDSTLYFEGIEAQNTSYKIYNLMGQNIAKGNIENNAINLNEISSGTYIIEVSDGFTSNTKKFIKK